MDLWQHLKEISQGNIAAASEMYSKCKAIEREKEEEIDRLSIKHRESMSRVLKSNAEKLQEMKYKLKDSNQELDETMAMAIEVSEEYNSLTNARKADAREYSKKQSDLESISQSRLAKLNQMKETESILRESIDSVKESADDKLANAHAQIAALMTQLADKNSTIEKLQSTVESTQWELEVSTIPCMYDSHCRNLFGLTILSSSLPRNCVLI